MPAPVTGTTAEIFVECAYVTLVGASIDGANEVVIALPPSAAGCYRVRAHVKNRDFGEDRDDEDPIEEHLLQIWAAPPAPEELLKATDEVGARWRQPSGWECGGGGPGSR